LKLNLSNKMANINGKQLANLQPSVRAAKSDSKKFIRLITE